MNPFARLMKDDVFLEDSGGHRSGPYKTGFSNKSISIFDGSISIVEGDKVIRPLPNGTEEYYTVTEVSYSSGLHTIPAHYTLALSKDNAIRRPVHQSTTNHINISGSQGIQIGDHNSQHLQLVLGEILQKIDAADARREDKEEAKNHLTQFLAHPLVSSVVGASLPAALGLLS